MPTRLENICSLEAVLCLEVPPGPLMQNTLNRCFVTAACLSSLSLKKDTVHPLAQPQQPRPGFSPAIPPCHVDLVVNFHFQQHVDGHTK